MPPLSIDLSGIQATLFEFSLGQYAVATVASASLGLLAVRRVWKMIRGSI